ncbi:MAG: hypothetical protein ABI560_01820 [Myxococcales bacterium]
MAAEQDDDDDGGGARSIGLRPNGLRANGPRDPAFLRAEAEIAEARERVALSVMKLEQEFNRAIDWREWVRRRPGRCLTVAFAVGLLLGRRH